MQEQIIPIAPPTYGASQFGLTMNALEVIVTFGHQRVIMSQETGKPSGQFGIEWLASHSISPQAAKQLFGAAQMLLEEYEKRYGKIPQDPESKAEMLKGQIVGSPTPQKA